MGAVVSDGAGGIIIGCDNSGPNYTIGGSDVFAQRLGSGAARLWAGGRVVCAAPGTQSRTRITDDGTGGAYLVWQDSRAADADIYAQRLNSTGIPVWPSLWPQDGLAVCTAAAHQHDPVAQLLGVGGIIVAWEDERTAGGTSIDIYVQHVDPNGALGLTVSDAGFSPEASRLAFSVGNPARRATWLAFRLPVPHDVVVRVHDVAGRERAVHHFAGLAAGEHVLPLDLSALPGGVYAVTLQGGAAAVTRKVSLIR